MNCKHSFLYFQSVAGLSAVFAIVLSAGGCKDATSGPGSESLSDPTVQPMVVSTLPISGSTGPFSLYNQGDGESKPHFVLTFNKLMYKGSFTLASFRIQGFERPVAARIEPFYYFERFQKISSASSVYYDNVLSFFIIDSSSYYGTMNYQLGKQYTITLDTTAEDINGNHLSAPYTFIYTPEPYFRVVGVYPKNGAKDVTIWSGASVYFNNSVDESIFEKLRITPAVAGYWIKPSPSSFRVDFLLTQSNLPFGSDFTLTVDASATDSELHQVDREYTSTFSTVAFRPTNIYPSNGSTDVSLASYVRMVFSGQIDTATVRSGFTLSPAEAGFFNFHNGFDGFDFYPVNGVHQNTTYTIGISSSLRSSDGTPALSTTSKFRTGPFEIWGTYPYNGSPGVSRSTYIQVSTNGWLDGSTISSSISFTPAIPGSFSFDGSTYIMYNPSELLSANTRYTVTISTALATRAGDHLPAPQTFWFTAGN